MPIKRTDTCLTVGGDAVQGLHLPIRQADGFLDAEKVQIGGLPVQQTGLAIRRVLLERNLLEERIVYRIIGRLLPRRRGGGSSLGWPLGASFWSATFWKN